MSIYKPGPFGGSVDDLPRYVQEELLKISATFETDAGAATLYRNEIGAEEIYGVVPRKFDDFDKFSPQRYSQNVVPDVASNSIFIRRSGMWGLAFTISGAVDRNATYKMEMYVDGTPIGLTHVVDASNQTDVVTMVAIATGRAIRQAPGQLEAEVALFMESTEGATWTTIDGYFSVWWCGD